MSLADDLILCFMSIKARLTGSTQLDCQDDYRRFLPPFVTF